MKRLSHHVRFSVAVGLEFQRDDHLQAVSFAIVNWMVNLSDLLAAWLAGLLIWQSAWPAAISNYLAGWAADLALIVEAARLLLLGRWLFLKPDLVN
jgi:hypothetical protein